MAGVLDFVLLGLAALSFLLGLASLAGGIAFRARVLRPASANVSFTPSTIVIVACKGVDEGMDRSLEALLAQDYPSYRVVFALDDYDDDAHPVIQRLAGSSKRPITVVVADPLRTATGKAAALIRAVKEVTPQDEVIAFMDSDARPPRTWLRSLVAPLRDGKVGAATTYRWYSHDRTLASAVRSAWNAAGTNIMFSERLNFAWGGSYAIRKETFEKTYVAAKWGSALSDDMVVTQAVKGAGLRVVYVPQATVVTDEPADWRGTVEWTTRQTVMMRAYDPRITRYAALAYATVAGSVDLAIALSLVAVIANPGLWLPSLLLLAHLPFTAAKAAVKLSTFRHITGQRLGPTGAFIAASLLVPWLALYNLNVARKLRVISWRGTLYELRGPAPIRVIRR